MCNKKQFKYCPSEIDDCMKFFIDYLNKSNTKTLACCCGHNKYPMSIVADVKGLHIELFTGIIINRKKRFYKKDAKGYYYIPEAVYNST